jgi:hypothetical protein
MSLAPLAGRGRHGAKRSAGEGFAAENGAPHPAFGHLLPAAAGRRTSVSVDFHLCQRSLSNDLEVPCLSISFLCCARARGRRPITSRSSVARRLCCPARAANDAHGRRGAIDVTDRRCRLRQNAAGLRSLDAALAARHVGRLLIHQPMGDVCLARDGRAESQGRVRAIGVSNFHPRDAFHLHQEVRPAVDEIETHPFHQQVEARGSSRRTPSINGARRGVPKQQ